MCSFSTLILLGLLTCKNRRPHNLYCVVETLNHAQSINQSIIPPCCWVLQSAESEHRRLTNHKIIFKEFQFICDHSPPTLQTDRHADGRTD